MIERKKANGVSKTEQTVFDGDDPYRLADDLKQVKDSRGITRVIIFDVAIMPGERAWAFVEDSINRSGTNPMRELSGLSENRFVDVSQMYVVPRGQAGVTILSLGTRFKAGARSRKIECGHLHNGAIVAHTMGFDVTAVVVAENLFEQFTLNEVLNLC